MFSTVCSLITVFPGKFGSVRVYFNIDIVRVRSVKWPSGCFFRFLLIGFYVSVQVVCKIGIVAVAGCVFGCFQAVNIVILHDSYSVGDFVEIWSCSTLLAEMFPLYWGCVPVFVVLIALQKKSFCFRKTVGTCL